METTIGIDVSDKYSRVCVLDAGGAVVEESRIATTGPALRRRFATGLQVRVAIEAGPHSAWISRLLGELGHEVIVANPRKLRLIYENDKKSDRVDAEWLARVARLDAKLLAPIHHREKESQAALALLRARDALVRARTQLVNHVRGTVKGFGVRLRRCSTHSFVTRMTTDLPADLSHTLGPVIEAIGTLTVVHGIHNLAALLARQPVEPDAVQVVQVGKGVHPARLEVWRDGLGGQFYSLVEYLPRPRFSYRLDCGGVRACLDHRSLQHAEHVINRFHL